MWSDQAKYFDTGDIEQFNAKHAYGHPGGPIILGMVLAHHVFSVPYTKDSMVFFMAFLNSLLIACISVCCFMLRRNSFWWVAVFGTLSIHRMFFNTTPPTALASFLLVFLCLLTLCICEQKEKIKTSVLLLWSVLVGLSIATRADIGIFVSAFISLILWRFIGWKALFLLLLNAFFVFFIFDPFMWFMPVQHIKDLFSKIVYHYADFRIKRMWLLEVVNISFISFLSMLSFVFTFFYKKGKFLFMPAVLGWSLLGMTFFLYYIFMTANYQVSRYYMPIIFIWETFFYLFLSTTIENTQITSTGGKAGVLTKRGAEIIIVSLLIGLQVGLSLDYLVFM